MLKNIAKDLKETLNGTTKVELTGENNLSISDIVLTARRNAQVDFSLSSKQQKKIEFMHQIMMQQVKEGIPIYGTNTGYGGRASVVLTEGVSKRRLDNASKLSRAIVHVDVTTGPAIDKDVVRGGMLLRINMLLPGHSAIRLEVLNSLRNLLNNNITPIIGQYGTVSSSGDLQLNGRVLSTLLLLDHVKVWDANGNTRYAKEVLSEIGMTPIELRPKEGLALVNGDNFSTAKAALLANDIASLLLLNTIVSAITIQAFKGSDRNFHPLLTSLRPHPGQELTARMYRNLLSESKLSFSELKGPIRREPGVSVQDQYSIRCLPQYYGPDWENLVKYWETITLNANSVSDNPLWTTPEFTTKGEEPYQWVSGGNFIAMHMAEVIDGLRKIMVHIVKQNDRHLARLVHPRFNNGLPANLSDKKAISRCTFKGLQTEMGMYEVYASMLGNPVTTMFGNHEEFNQDITSHAFTSGIIGNELLRLTKYAIAINFIAACQAIDLRGGPELLSPKTRPFYDWIRALVPYIEKEQPLGHYVEEVALHLLDKDSQKLVLKQLGL